MSVTTRRRRLARRLALDTILPPEPNTRVTGFKEIRWADEDVAEYVEWWRRVFPGARLLDLATSLGEAGFRVHYDDYAADPSRLRPLFEWLGEEYDEPRLRAVMETRHSY